MQRDWEVLQTEEEYDIALDRAIEIFHVDKNSSEGMELRLLISLIKEYEDSHYRIPKPNPIETI